METILKNAIELTEEEVDQLYARYPDLEGRDIGVLVQEMDNELEEVLIKFDELEKDSTYYCLSNPNPLKGDIWYKV